MDKQLVMECYREDPMPMLEELGIEVDRKSIGRRSIRVLCPLHDDHEFGNAWVKDGYFTCMACHNGQGDLSQLAMEMLGIKYDEALKLAAEVYHLDFQYDNVGTEYRRLLLTKEEVEALDFPSTNISLNSIRNTDEEKWKKIILHRCSQQLAKYADLDSKFGSRDGDEAYLFGMYVNCISPKVFSDIHSMLKKRIKTLHDLEERL